MRKMNEYEYTWSMMLLSKLKCRIRNKRIFVTVTSDDDLIVRIEHEDGLIFELTYDNFSRRLLYGFSTDQVSSEIIQKYKNYIIERIMENYFW